MDLRGACLAETDLSWARLEGTLIDRKTILDDKWRLVWELVNGLGGGRDLRGVDLRDADLARAALHGADLSGADLSHALLPEANLTCANLSGCNLHKALLWGAFLGDPAG